jgi:hypothetical protein
MKQEEEQDQVMVQEHVDKSEVQVRMRVLQARGTRKSK